jgi:hypothetical protein
VSIRTTNTAGLSWAGRHLSPARKHPSSTSYHFLHCPTPKSGLLPPALLFLLL